MPDELLRAILWFRADFSADKFRRSLERPDPDEPDQLVFDDDLAAQSLNLVRLVRMGLRGCDVPGLARIIFDHCFDAEPEFVRRALAALGPRLGMVRDLASPGPQLSPDAFTQLDALREQLCRACEALETIVQECDPAQFGRPAHLLDQL